VLKVFFVMILVAVGSYGTYYQTSAMLQSTVALHTETLATTSISRLKQDARWVGNKYILPFGHNGVNYHELPLDYAGIRFTRSGIPFMYCPFSDTAVITKDAEVKLNSTDSYDVGIYNGISTGGKDYVAESDTAPVPDIIAAVISPKSGLSLPNCEDIVVNAAGNYTLTGSSQGKGRVFVLHEGQVTTNNEATSTYLATASGGDLDATIAEAAARPMQDHIINLASSDTFTVTGDMILSGVSGQRRSQVTIIGVDPANPSTISVGSGGLLSSVGIDLVLQNVVLDKIAVYLEDATGDFNNISAEKITLVDADLEVSDASFDRQGTSEEALDAYRSRILIRDGLSLEGTNGTVANVQDSEVLVDSAAVTFDSTASGIQLQLFNSEWNQRGGSVSFVAPATQAMVYADPSSLMSFSGVTISESGNYTYGLYIEGRIFSDNSSFNVNSGTVLHMAPGSVGRLDSVVVGSSTSSPSKGIVDAGARSLVGTADVYGTICREGDMFSGPETDTVADESVSIVNPDFSVVKGTANRTVSIDVAKYLNKITLNCL